MDVRLINLEYLGTRRDARAIDEAAVRGLVESIREIGIINPLRVRPKRLYVNGVEDDGFEVIAGAHRLRAARHIGLAEVPCVVVADDDIDAEIAMIDENLSRAELSPADRASQTARRKALYLKKHPDTAHGSPGVSRQVGDTHDRAEAERFTANTAGRTGQSERAVQRDAERGEKVCPEALDLIRGTDLDKGTYLDKLKKIDSPEEQVATVNRALSGIARAAEREKAEAQEKRARTRIEADVKARAAREVAEILAQEVDGHLWDGLKANLYAAGAKNIADELNNIIGASIIQVEAA